MLASMQWGIVESGALAIDALLAEMQDEDELFASRNTLARIERLLLVIAQTLEHLSPALRLRLGRIDWHGWRALRDVLDQRRAPRRNEVWYGVSALLPATLERFEDLRRREPVWFESGY